VQVAKRREGTCGTEGTRHCTPAMSLHCPTALHVPWVACGHECALADLPHQMADAWSEMPASMLPIAKQRCQPSAFRGLKGVQLDVVDATPPSVYACRMQVMRVLTDVQWCYARLVSSLRDLRSGTVACHSSCNARQLSAASVIACSACSRMSNLWKSCSCQSCQQPGMTRVGHTAAPHTPAARRYPVPSR
jgi:hypothetical protein